MSGSKHNTLFFCSHVDEISTFATIDALDFACTVTASEATVSARTDTLHMHLHLFSMCGRL